MPRITLGFIRAACLCLSFTMVFACTSVDDRAAQTFDDPIEGVWLLGTDQSRLNISPCGSKRDDGFCGTLTEKQEDIDVWNNSGILEWGRPRNPVQIVTLRPTEIEGEYVGQMYDPELDETLHLHLVHVNEETVDAVLYFGTSFDEAVDMAAGAIFSPVDVTDLAWLLTRAGVGKTWLSSNQTWRRAVPAERV